ncbi:MAG: glutamine synthetase III [Kiritimatiellae bacterium]|nr:glutamine synthetase III [Kiritimatiellia bacterium]
MSAKSKKPSPAPDAGVDVKHPAHLFGVNVFSLRTMRAYLSEPAYESLAATICEGRSLASGIADEVAEAMKTWAIAKGATHFTHWFQPLTGATAEKHESFIVPDRQGGAILQFSGKELIKGEPDASSFPSGGLRATFEARGYTAWDPTSPAFVKEGANGATLCIPTAFFAYHGEALDQKTPLLRSLEALSRQVCRLGELFGLECPGKRAFAELGWEQEYFLVDREFYNRRLDLLQTGRTLFGTRPAKHQQMGDHYFGAIRSRVLAFMEDLDRELWKLGVPAKMRHNEACPAQFEIAAVYEELNLAVDHNMVAMQALRETAAAHGFVCLLHEKPFAGVNGSGKHNNWNIVGPDGRNWLTPGENPHENAKFLTLICALMKAIDTRAGILRASVATAGNDHRLGAHEAPPAILSIFLGDQLSDVIEQIANGGAKTARAGGTLHVGVSSLPPLPRDATDRNRTSPFAFTGNKFEFRAVGSNQSCAGPNAVLNTIVAEALDDICTRLETALAAGKPFNESLETILRDLVNRHGRILFNGDNYTAEWHAEAERRGLANVRTTPEALGAFLDPDVTAMFEKYNVLSERELKSRYEVYRQEYEGLVAIEAGCAVRMARTMIVPAAIEYQSGLAAAINSVDSVGHGCQMHAVKELLSRVCADNERVLLAVDRLETARKQGETAAMRAATADLRSAVDALEELVPHDLWPLPSYAEMMFMM